MWASLSCASEAQIHVVVNMVQLNVAVTDHKGNYITGLRPQDFIVTEDQIPETIATFGEGNQPVHRVAESPAPSTPNDGATDSAAVPAQGGPQPLDPSTLG